MESNRWFDVLRNNISGCIEDGKSRPRHERQGQDMPQMLEEQIRSLPWLSTDECEAVIDRSNQESKLNRKTAE